MTKTAQLIENEPTALAVININPVAVYTNAEAFDEYYERVKAKVTEGFTPDLTTDKGRKAIASQAFVVVKEKTALVAAGKKLTEDARAMIKQVNEARNGMEERLDALAKEVRRPLTEWETAENERVKWCELMIGELREAATVQIGETALEVGDRLADIEALVIDASLYQEFAEMAESLKATAVQSLTAALARVRKEEADRAELEALRAAQIERDRIAAEQAAEAERLRLEAEAVELDRIEAERQEAALKAAQEAEAAKIEAAREQARLDAIAQAEAEARAEIAESERKAAEALAAQQAESERILAEERANAQAEIDRLEAEAAIARAAERERQRIEQAAADLAEKTRREDEARTADRAHRSSVLKTAKESIMATCDIDEPLAKKIILAIAAGEIPNVSIRF